MTAQAHTLFICDRCDKREYVPTQNTTLHERVSMKDWTSLWLNDMSKPPWHLCPACSTAHAHFMDNEDLEEKFNALNKLHGEAMAAIRRLKLQRDEAYRKSSQTPPVLTDIEKQAELVEGEVIEPLPRMRPLVKNTTS